MASKATSASASTLLAALGLACLLCSLGAASAQDCSGQLMHMSCNVPALCQAYFGSTQYVGDESDCTCLSLCEAAREQGEGSYCDVRPGVTEDEFWVRAYFDQADGDNWHRGTVFCDPRGGGGNGLSG